MWLKVRVLDPTGDEPAVQVINPVGYKMANVNILDDTMKWLDGDGPRMLLLSPGESTMFSAHAKIPRERVVSVEALIVGTRLSNQFALLKQDWMWHQWKASIIVLPNTSRNV